MRVTGGVWRSRRLLGPKAGQPIRPTSDQLRERAFAVLGERVRGTVFLDLFCGTGAVGIEALSRGAEQAIFVDSHHTATTLVRRNLEALDVPSERWMLITASASRAVRRLAAAGVRCRMAWADPPFERWAMGVEALLACWEEGVLETGGTGCLECPARASVAEALDGRLKVQRELAGGTSRLLLLETVGAVY